MKRPNTKVAGFLHYNVNFLPVIMLAVILFGSGHQVLEAADTKATAEALLSFDNLRPGLAVFIGSSDAAVPVELASAGKYHVHCLSSDQAGVEKMREYVETKNVYGKVVVDDCALESLPYPNNLINMLIVEDFNALQKKGVTVKEIMRVVAPYSSAIIGNVPADLKQMLSQARYTHGVINKKGMWTRIIKPWPEEMDEWPQQSYDATGSSISSDRLVRPPNSVQWIAGDTWRHESGPKSLLSANGRVFSYSKDQGIVARDAFNGRELWQREGAGISIASGDQLFGRLENGGTLVALDSRTGETIRKYSFGGFAKSWPPQARVAYQDGILLTGAIGGGIKAYDVNSGEELWKKKVSGEKYTVGSTLAMYRQINNKRVIADGRIFLTLNTKKEFLCLELKTGRELWRVPSQGDRLVCCRDGILFSQYMRKGTNTEEVVFNAAYSAEDGTFLWRHDYTKVWHSGNPHNIFFVDGLVWVLASVVSENVSFTKYPQVWHGLNPKTGEVVKRIDWKKIKHRCYGDRATGRYIMSGGIDFLDVTTGKVHAFYAARGNCSFGFMPANGLVYQPPNTCWCYPQVRGFVAFTADTLTAEQEDKQKGELLQLKGNGTPADEEPSADDWPMLRHDPARSGGTAAALPSELKPIWTEKISRSLSSPVIACGKVFAASVDDHRVIALDLKTGREVWSFRANGRVDSPPTIYAGRAFFGDRDGWVHCVSSATGELIWSLQAVPRQRWLLSSGQVESAWPIYGSILIDNEKAYFAAGRHSYVDGGVYLYAASPKNGSILWRTCKTSPGRIRNDILASSGKTITMQKGAFDPKTGSAVKEHVSFLSGSGGGFLADPGNRLGGGHEGYRMWSYRDKSCSWGSRITGFTLAFAEQDAFGVRGVRASKKSKEVSLEIFRCSKKKGTKQTFWKTVLPQGVWPKALLSAGSKVFVATINEVDAPTKGVILVYDANDGKSLGSIPVNLAPRFDGMAAVKDYLIVTGQDGKVICLSGKSK